MPPQIYTESKLWQFSHDIVTYGYKRILEVGSQAEYECLKQVRQMALELSTSIAEAWGYTGAFREKEVPSSITTALNNLFEYLELSHSQKALSVEDFLVFNEHVQGMRDRLKELSGEIVEEVVKEN